jgi:hypothetical protein
MPYDTYFKYLTGKIKKPRSTEDRHRKIAVLNKNFSSLKNDNSNTHNSNTLHKSSEKKKIQT